MAEQSEGGGGGGAPAPVAGPLPPAAPAGRFDAAPETTEPGGAPSGLERRAQPRLSVGLSAHCQIEGIVSQEALGDLSEGGLFLRTAVQVRAGSKVRIVLGLPYIGGQRVCSLSGKIVRVVTDPQSGRVTGAGVQFDHETDAADHELLRGFLALWRTSRAP